MGIQILIIPVHKSGFGRDKSKMNAYKKVLHLYTRIKKRGGEREEEEKEVPDPGL